MRTLCFYFQVHQPFRLKDPYRFFDIGSDHYYYDDYSNHAIMRKVAEKCYLPTNQAMLDLIMEYGKKFKISYSLSGTVLDQFEKYAPDVLESFKQLVNTGSVEILSETYSHSLSALKSKQEFIEQVKAHDDKVFQLFGVKPTTFRNTELIYSDFIGEMVAEMGYKAMLTEGAKHILGWKSPNFLYYNAYNPKLKVLLKNFKLSDDVAFRFSNREWDEYPLTTEKYVTWLNSTQGDTINLFMDYETFGEHQWADTGIFQFLRALPNAIFRYAPDLQFATPSEAAEIHQSVAEISVPYPISWADEERDLTAWLGNELQDEAFAKLYDLAPMVRGIEDAQIQRDWKYLQTSDHFYYMCTKFFSDGNVHKYFSPYNNPYDAFINFMNVLTDFKIRVQKYLAERSNRLDLLSADEIRQIVSFKEKEIEELRTRIKPGHIVVDKTKEVSNVLPETKETEKKEEKPAEQEKYKRIYKRKETTEEKENEEKEVKKTEAKKPSKPRKTKKE